ncbi:LysR family transcriptional regulator [Desulfovibrio sp. TomC]|uniref:LysR family transcriptional regulator n=1 Tax=Desulfovibrio sp. TomC TaxID=1562888 RepID=UPI000574AA87|nr:LysR family transcriptional regulator [Desulfovibrio sp. TomC]KHK03105.1 Transcriptional regulator [Desulfovibrio sp. TomC]
MKAPHFADYLAVFVDVVRAGSFSAAARDRAVTPSAIVRQINTLEQELGVPLLIRSTRSLTMTDAGQSLFERAKRLLDDLADAHAEVSAFHGLVAGTLRVACFPTFGKRYVLPVLAKLQAEYPSLKVELDLNEKLGDPVLERLDVVIRMGELPDSTLIAAKLAPLNRVLAASPAYLGRKGVPSDVAELAGHRLLDKLHRADLLGWSDVLGRPAAEVSNDPVAFRSDDFEALRGAAIAGMGVTFLPTWVVGPDIKAGVLTRIPLAGEPWNARPSGIYLLRSVPLPSAKVRAFVEALRAFINAPPIWEP